MATGSRSKITPETQEEARRLRETPKLYFEGVRDIVRAFRPHPPQQPGQVGTPSSKAAPSQIRIKSNRIKRAKR